MAGDDYDNMQEPGALTGGQKVWAGIKHIAQKALKFAVIGGIIGAALFAIAPASFLTPLAALVGTFSSGGAAGIMRVVGSTAMAGAQALGTAGLMVGAALALMGVGDAVSDADQESRDNAARGIVRNQKMRGIAQQRDMQAMAYARQSKALGMDNPNLNLPGGKGTGREQSFFG